MPISKRNRRGVLFLLLLGVLISFTPRVLSNFAQSDDPIISFKEAKVVESDIIEHKRDWKKKKKPKKIKKRFSIPETRFDPNQYSEADWMKLGISKKQAQVVMHFAERGMKSDDDLRKIYVLPAEFIDIIQDSTYYPEGYSYSREKDAFTEQDKSQLLVPLNAADEEALRQITGIGPYFATKIIFYREELGGYANKEQLLEIWKFDIEKYQQIRNFLELDEVEMRTISINKATINELKEHPYIDYSVANSIVKMRDQIGEYTALAQVKRSRLIDEITYQKLLPYLSL
ncbi:MAG: competence protein ComEA [Flavobacteriaceae bacterium]